MHRAAGKVAEFCVFSRTGTGNIKGLAILIMLAHHLFGMYSVQISEELRYPEAVESFAWNGKVCVLLFLFVTGYGYRCAAEHDKLPMLKSVWRRIVRFYPMFLVMLAIVAFLSAMGGHYCLADSSTFADNWRGYLLAATGAMNLYLDFWYIGVFLWGALAMYPLLLWGLRRGPWAEALVFLGLAALCVANPWPTEILQKVVYTSLSPFVSSETIQLVNKGSWAIALAWLDCLLLGWAFAAAVHRDKGALFLLSIGVLSSWWLHDDLFIWLCGCLLASKLACQWHVGSTLLGKLGALSAVMWLNHRLLFGYWYADFFYSTPAPFNYLLLVVLSALAAQIFLWLYNGAAHIVAGLLGRSHPSVCATEPKKMEKN